MQHVRAAIIGRRQRLGLTLERAAAATRGKVSVGQWWYMENAADERIDRLAAACKVLGLRLSTLIAQAENRAAARKM